MNPCCISPLLMKYLCELFTLHALLPLKQESSNCILTWSGGACGVGCCCCCGMSPLPVCCCCWDRLLLPVAQFSSIGCCLSETTFVATLFFHIEFRAGWKKRFWKTHKWVEERGREKKKNWFISFAVITKRCEKERRKEEGRKKWMKDLKQMILCVRTHRVASYGWLSAMR